MSLPATLQFRITGREAGSVEVDLKSSNGSDLKTAILESAFGEGASSVPLDAVRVLVSGKFIKDELALEQQGIKPDSKLMVMVKGDSPVTGAATTTTTTSNSTGQATSSNGSGQSSAEIDQQIEEARKIETWAAAAAELASREDSNHGSRYYFELRDQSGREMTIPVSEKRALIFGMTLQEKARTLLKEGKTPLALELLLKADRDGFSKVGFQLLDLIDNYGLLCLDIAWAYFKLRDPTFMKDADARLANARRCLEKSHGRDLERLITIKGPEAPERVLYLRLELLEGVLAYHQGKQLEAQTRIAEAARQLQLYKVTDDEIVPMLAMGFGERESRLALRACGKDVNRASVYVLQKREEEAQKRELERKERQEKKERQKYGKTANGDWVSVALVESLGALGFDLGLIIEALKQTDNREEAALNLLLNQPELLRAAKKPRTKATPALPPDETQLGILVSMGYTQAQATAALQSANNDVDQAVSLLSSGDVSLPTEGEENLSMEGAEESTSTAPEEPVESPEEQARREEQERAAEEERIRKETEVADLIGDIDVDEQSALDIPLDEEEKAIQDYAKLLGLP